ncbi:MAG: hypothetical protein EOO89_09845 [Pedobacter sp.]|nr:MAG: hypothetical protein EOO89_09845 [Pedobacter sp.]
MSKLIGKVSSYDKIVGYMKDPDAEVISLSEHEQVMLNRWMEAFTLQRNYTTTADAAAILMKRFPGISRATAHRDCINSISMFGDIAKATKDGMKHLATEIVRDGIAIARMKNNEDAMIKGGVAIAKINGVNLVDPDIPRFDLLEQNVYEVTLPTGAISLLEALLKGGRVDLTSMVDGMGAHAEDAVIDTEEDDNGGS